MCHDLTEVVGTGLFLRVRQLHSVLAGSGFLLLFLFRLFLGRFFLRLFLRLFLGGLFLCRLHGLVPQELDLLVSELVDIDAVFGSQLRKKLSFCELGSLFVTQGSVHGGQIQIHHGRMTPQTWLWLFHVFSEGNPLSTSTLRSV